MQTGTSLSSWVIYDVGGQPTPATLRQTDGRTDRLTCWLLYGRANVWWIERRRKYDSIRLTAWHDTGVKSRQQITTLIMFARWHDDILHLSPPPCLNALLCFTINPRHASLLSGVRLPGYASDEVRAVKNVSQLTTYVVGYLCCTKHFTRYWR